MEETVRYSERLLEDLYKVYGDLGSFGRSIEFLSRSLSLPEKYVEDLVANLESIIN